MDYRRHSYQEQHPHPRTAACVLHRVVRQRSDHFHLASPTQSDLSHLSSPNLVERIASITDVFRAQSTDTAETTPPDGKPNQLLINEYSAGQGIAVRLSGFLLIVLPLTMSLS